MWVDWLHMLLSHVVHSVNFCTKSHLESGFLNRQIMLPLHGMWCWSSILLLNPSRLGPKCWHRAGLLGHLQQRTIKRWLLIDGAGWHGFDATFQIYQPLSRQHF